MAALQVQEAYDAFGRLKRDITDVPLATFYEWCDYLNKFAYRYLIGIDPERFVSSSSVNVVAGTTSYSLPADFRSLQASGTGLFELDTDGNPTGYTLAVTGFGSQNEGYYISGSNIVITPNPTKSANYTFRYIPDVTTIDESTDYFTVSTALDSDIILPSEFKEYVVKALDVFYNQWDEDLAMESFSDARFIRALDELARTYKRTPDVYGLPDYTIYY